MENQIGQTIPNIHNKIQSTTSKVRKRKRRRHRSIAQSNDIANFKIVRKIVKQESTDSCFFNLDNQVQIAHKLQQFCTIHLHQYQILGDDLGKFFRFYPFLSYLT